MTKPKVTVTIARALAEMAQTQIATVRNKLLDGDKEKTLRSAEVKKLRSLYKERNKLDSQIKQLVATVNRKFNVVITAYNSRDISVSRYGRDKLPSIDELKNQIIIASHVHGLDSEKLVEAMVKRFTK